MKTLSEHNRDVTEQMMRSLRKRAGVLCDKCRTEMEIVEAERVECPACR